MYSLQTDNLDDILLLSSILDACCDVVPDTLHETKYNLCLCVSQISVQLISFGFNPTYMFQRINNLLEICPCASDIIVLCISRTLSLCSSKFVLAIIDFCENFFKTFLFKKMYQFLILLFTH